VPDPLPEAIPAATLILMRERHGSAPEFLFVERARTLAFAGGALVFPGGRIDAEDHRIGGDERPAAAARVAAIRETIEEAGIGVALKPMLLPAALAAVRVGLHRGRSFADLLDEAGCRLALDVLEPFARWRPAHRHQRIFDTHFFLASLSDDGQVAVPDRQETAAVQWATAKAVLDAADAGAATIIFPTRRTLERLALFDTYAAAVADARRHPIRPITPWVEDRGGTAHLCIDDDLGYPVTAEPLSGALRG
jgi:8-oxo-dGTP pyrophosphatase MutT (NUDIX family)